MMRRFAPAGVLLALTAACTTPGTAPAVEVSAPAAGATPRPVQADEVAALHSRIDALTARLEQLERRPMPLSSAGPQPMTMAPFPQDPALAPPDRPRPIVPQAGVRRPDPLLNPRGIDVLTGRPLPPAPAMRPGAPGGPMGG